MHGAGFQGRAGIAKALIKHGLDPSDMHGALAAPRIAAHLAPACTSALPPPPVLTVAAALDLCCAADGFTPIHRSCWGNDRRHTDTVKVFLEAGVPYNQVASVPYLLYIPLPPSVRPLTTSTPRTG